jgi:hypothetical protein
MTKIKSVENSTDQLLERIAEALEQQARQGKEQLDAYNKSQHDTLMVMAKREERDLEQIERIKQRHEWDKEAHEIHMKEAKMKLEREEFWKKELSKNVGKGEIWK